MQKNANFDSLFPEQATQQPANQTVQQPAQQPTDKEAWAARRQQEREAVFQQIDETVSAMSGDGELFQTYLDVQARFDRYSVSNAVLITNQRPEATRLADFNAWKAAGCYVRKGASSISILEPGKEYKREDGSTGVYYNVKRVFDISQTTALAKPTPVAQTDNRQLLKALMNDPPCTIVGIDELPEGRNAAYLPKENTIVVRKGLDAPIIFRGLAQELARVHLDRSGKNCENPDFAAYSAAYLLCKKNGVPVDSFSFQQMPESYKKMEPQQLRKELGAIRAAAGEVISCMNRYFEAQQRSQKNRDQGAR